MKFINISTILLLLFTFALFSCSDNPADAEVEVTENGQTLYLLGMDADPMGIESDDSGTFDSHFRSGFMGRHFGKGAGGRPAFCMDALGRLTESLGLTADQIAQIEPIADRYKASFDALAAQWQEGAAWSELHEQRKSLREAFMEEIKPILTEDQIAQLEEMRSKFDRGQFPERMAERRLAWLTRTLALTTDQQDQISALLVAAGTELMTLRDNSESREAFHEAAKPILEALNQDIAALLTEEQLELYNEFPRHKRWRDRYQGHQR